jgi:hypothetical protein
MELRKLTEDDLKNNSGLLSYAYNTNKDLFPLFFEYEYDGDVKYLYCYDNWFTILCKKSDKQLKHYQFALDDEYELLYSGYEDFYVDHKSNASDTIIDILNSEDVEDKGIDETELNDFLWFEDNTYAEWLGYEDAEDLWQHRRSDEY